MNTPFCLGSVAVITLFALAPVRAVVRETADARPLVAKPVPPEQRANPVTLLDVPLRDPAISRAPDGTYYRAHLDTTTIMGV